MNLGKNRLLIGRETVFSDFLDLLHLCEIIPVQRKGNSVIELGFS